jgi:hypothetical protein
MVVASATTDVAALDVLGLLACRQNDQADMLLAFVQLPKSGRAKLLALAKQMAAEKAKK